VGLVLFETVIACRQSPTKLVGATCPIGTVHVTAARDLRLWYPQQRTTRLHRAHELGGIVTLTTSYRWGDFAEEYVELIARACDGIVAIDGEANELLDPLPISDRELAVEWRVLDARARRAIEDHDRALRKQRAEAPALRSAAAS
jgi:hypothetical protein